VDQTKPQQAVLGSAVTFEQSLAEHAGVEPFHSLGCK